jgi:hypothetical protein
VTDRKREKKKNFRELQTLPVVEGVIIPWLDELEIISSIKLFEGFLGVD